MLGMMGGPRLVVGWVLVLRLLSVTVTIDTPTCTTSPSTPIFSICTRGLGKRSLQHFQRRNHRTLFNLILFVRVRGRAVIVMSGCNL